MVTQSVLGILFKKTRAEIGSITLDASISEMHESNADVTENPIEDGANVVDHIQVRPIELTIDGIISDAPLGFAVIQNIQNLTRTIGGIFGKKSRSIEAYEQLLELQKKREPVTVITGLKKYDNMVITSISAPRSAETGNALLFTARMREIKIAKSKTEEAKNFKNDQVKDRASSTKDQGLKNTDMEPQSSPNSASPTGKVASSNSSLLFKGYKSLSGFFSGGG